MSTSSRDVQVTSPTRQAASAISSRRSRHTVNVRRPSANRLMIALQLQITARFHVALWLGSKLSTVVGRIEECVPSFSELEFAGNPKVRKFAGRNAQHLPRLGTR